MYIKHCEKSEIVCTDWIVLFEVIKMLSFQLCLIAFFVCVCVILGQKYSQVCNSLTKTLSVVFKALQQNLKFRLSQE